MLNMSKRKMFLSVYELKPGMIIAEEIKSQNTILINKGMAVTDILIDKLKEQYSFYKIAVYVNDKQSASLNDIAKGNGKTVEDIEKSFNEFSFNVEDIFKNVYDEGISDIEEIRKFAQRIQEEINSTRAVIKNIVLYGSGDDAIYRHSVNVAALSSILGKWIGLSEKKVNLLTYSAILHDFGKTKINKNILNKPGSLTAQEYRQIKRHPVLAYDFIKKVPYLDNSVSYGVLMHHERLDGSGYPLGIKEDKIHPFAKIIAITDVFDAVNSNRIYRKSKGPFEALEIIQKESLGKLDYKYSRIFLEHIINYYMGENVLLNNNRVCKIIQININELSRPLLLDNSEFVDLRKEKNLYIENLVL